MQALQCVFNALGLGKTTKPIDTDDELEDSEVLAAPPQPSMGSRGPNEKGYCPDKKTILPLGNP